MNTKLFSAILALSLPFGLAAKDWAPANNNLPTPWTGKVSPKKVHQEYPRPQMVREDWKSLNGLWDYSITSADAISEGEANGKILVPFPIESALSGVGKSVSADQALWYTTSFELPRGWKDKKVILHFGAVDWSCQVCVNGVIMGTHTGGYTSFEYNITPHLVKDGAQVVTLKVTDATDAWFQPRGKQISNPNGIWYTANTGIWQSVWMEAVPMDAYVKDYKVSSDVDGGVITVTPVCEDVREGDMVKVELLEGGQGYNPEKPSKTFLASASAKAGESVSVSVGEKHLWSPDDPYLYGLRISIVRKNKTIDKVEAYTSLREVSMVYGTTGIKRIGLNGKPVFNYGPLDQGWWPDGLYTAPTDEALKFDIVKTKEFGFNMIRKHVKVEPARWYYWCDVLGVMVWQDMPSTMDNGTNIWATTSFEGTDSAISLEGKENYYKEWSEIMDQLDKFQCITVWVPFNEAWGQFDTEKVVEFTRERAAGRLINSASGGNFVKGIDGKTVGDIVDAHNYPEPWPGMWDEEKISVVGEYGGIGLPVKKHLWQKDRNWGYIEFKNSKELTDKYVELTEHLKVQVEEKGCSAAVYTQTTDVEGEVNGLMTYDRKVVKPDVKRIAAANASVIASMK